MRFLKMPDCLKTSIEASDDRSAAADDARASDSETTLCFQKRVMKTLDNFGLSHGSKELNIPYILSSIMSVMMIYIITKRKQDSILNILVGIKLNKDTNTI